MQQQNASANARISAMLAIRNIDGAVTRLTRICTERKADYTVPERKADYTIPECKADYTGGRYAGSEEISPCQD